MKEEASLSPEVIQSLVQLAGLRLSPARLERLAPRLDRFYQDALRLEKFNFEAVEPPLYFLP